MKRSHRTPEGFDLNPGRVMPYRGRVDDPFGFGVHRPTLTRRNQGTAQIAAFETEREFRFSRTFDDPRPRTSSTVLIF